MQQARLADGVGLRAHLARGQRGGDAAHGGQGHVFARGHGGGQRGRAFGFHGHQGHVVPAVALQAFGHAGQQAAAAHRQHHRVRFHAGAGYFIDHAGMALPQQRVVEWMQESILRREHSLRQRVGFLPGGAVHDDFGAFLRDQGPGPRAGRFRHHDDDGNAQAASRISHGDAGIAAGRRDETAGAAPRVFFAGETDAADLEGAGRLQGFELEPDGAVAVQAQGARVEQRGFDVQGHACSW